MLATVGHLVAYGSAFAPGGAPPWAPWLFAGSTIVAMAAITALGAARGRAGLGAVRLPLLVMTLLLLAGFATALALPPVTAASPLWLGLPPAAAVLLYGVGLLPTLVLPLAYARSFDAFTLTEGDLARIRAAAAARAPGDVTGAGDAP